MMIGELENCRSSLVILHRRQITPVMFAEYREEWARSAPISRPACEPSTSSPGDGCNVASQVARTFVD
jgi:hypothetical protein